MNPKEIDHEILTVKEISDLLQVHQSTIYKMVRQARFPAFGSARTGDSEKT